MARRAGHGRRGEREVPCYAEGRCPQGGGAATDRSSSSYCSFALGGTRYSEPPSLVSILMPFSPYAIAGGTWITRLPPSFIVASASSTPGLRIGCFLNFAAIGLRPGPSLLSNIWPDGRYALYFSLIRSPACGTQATLKVPHLPTSRSKYLTPPSVSKKLRRRRQSRLLEQERRSSRSTRHELPAPHRRGKLLHSGPRLRQHSDGVN
mmetsp:Transcript_35400/g.115610  ORF Transcript_35400/g.115610 Transcript_35400/m.115610 type:complete len:207 (+) Transcript_35400:200-820(+)